MNKLRGWVFFDIDGTLLHAPGAGRAAFAEAFAGAFGWEQGVEHINFYGATDLRVFRQICAERGVEPDAKMERTFFEHLAPALEERLIRQPPLLYPGVRRLLERLHGGWKLGVITGNIEATARAKLRCAGIDHYFNAGGFGCGHADRAEIARQALQRARFPKHAALVGDTPSDIDAARANGMTAIAVATGGFTAQELQDAGADFVLNDLTDTERVLAVLE